MINNLARVLVFLFIGFVAMGLGMFCAELAEGGNDDELYDDEINQ